MVTIEAKIEDIISFVGEKIAKSTLSIFLLYMREVEKFSTFFFFFIGLNVLTIYGEERFFPRSGREEYFEYISTNKNNLKRKEIL